MRSETIGNRSRCGTTSVVAVVAASTFALVACQHTDGESPQTAPSTTKQPSAPEATRVGAAGSACEMPVTFGLAESWKPKAVDIAPDNPLAELARQGPLTMVCEIDAKPAGSIGFLRVWTGSKGELRPILEAFIGTDAQEPVFTELRINDRPALEVAYQEKDKLEDVLERERAFVVETARGVTAVSLDSADSEEYASMLPAYELAKSSLTVAPDGAQPPKPTGGQ